MGIGSKPKSTPSDVKGNTSVMPTITMVVINRYFPGELLKKGPRLRITRTIRLAEITDSTNQPVLNILIELLKTKRSTPKVT